MKKHSKTIFNLAILALTVILSAIFLLVPLTGENAPQAAHNNHDYTDKDGNAITATDLSELAELGIITEVCHTPEKYLNPTSYYDGEFGDATPIDELVPAEFGTLRFCILNIDPTREDFDEAVARLEKFKITKASAVAAITLRFTFNCSSATIYQGVNYRDSVGVMQDYEINDYMPAFSQDNIALNDDGKMKPIEFEIQFRLTRKNIPPDRLDAAAYITVHYQTEKGQTSILDAPLFGTKKAVENAVNTQKDALFTLLAVCALVLFAFALLILIKRQFSFVGHLIALAAVLLLVLSAYLPYGAFSPLTLPSVLKALAVGMLSFSAIICMQPSQKLKNPYYAVLSLSGINIVVLPLLAGLGVTGGVPLYTILTSALFAAGAVCFGVFDFIKNKNGLRLCVPLLAAFTAIGAYAVPAQSYTFPPYLLVAALIALGIFLLIATEFILAEQRNRYLTENLQAEVNAQTATLKSAIDDKNRLLTFIAHDLRKPAVSISDALLKINDETLDENNLHIFRGVSAKIDRIKDSFFEVSAHMKESFVEEDFASFNLAVFLSSVLEPLRTDCTAAGIVLSAAIPKRINVYAKQNALASIVDNLILNAVEHADCTRITVSASRAAGFVTLTVTDDGKGMGSTADIFSPYIGADEHEENLGLGLFIVKSQVEAMGGTIDCSSSHQGTMFTVKLISK